MTPISASAASYPSSASLQTGERAKTPGSLGFRRIVPSTAPIGTKAPILSFTPLSEEKSPGSSPALGASPSNSIATTTSPFASPSYSPAVGFSPLPSSRSRKVTVIKNDQDLAVTSDTPLKIPRVPNPAKDSFKALREYSKYLRLQKPAPTTFAKLPSFNPLVLPPAFSVSSSQSQFEEVMPQMISSRVTVSTPSNKMFESGHKSKHKRVLPKLPEKRKLKSIKEESWVDIVAENSRLIKV